MTIDLENTSLQNLATAFPRAGASALNKMATQAKTEASRRVRARYNIKKSDLDSNFKMKRANINHLESSVTASGKRLPLIDFGARQRKVGVSVMVIRGQRKVVAHAFITTMRSGHEGVFRRTGKERLPIQELVSLSVPKMFGSRNIMAAMKDFVRLKIRPLLMHEIEYFRKRAA